MKNRYLLAFLLTGCTGLFDGERVTPCETSAECNGGVCATQNLLGRGICVGGAIRETRFDQPHTYGVDCMVLIPMIIRPTTNNTPGQAVRDNSKTICRRGGCTLFPEASCYPACEPGR